MLQNILLLIVDTAASVLGGVMLLRFWMQVARVRPPMSIAQFVFQLSDWLVRPMRRILPSAGGVDWASLIGALLIALLAAFIDLALSSPFIAPQMVLLFAVMKLVQWIYYGLMGLILLDVIFSWVNPMAPLAPFVRALNEPVMQPLRRVIPPLGGLDLSPMVALLLLQVADQLIVRLLASALI